MSIARISKYFLFCCCFIGNFSAHAANLTIDPIWLEAKGRIVDPRAGLLPGDTLFFLAGNYQNVVLKGLIGTSDKPIVVMNVGGQVKFSHEHYRGAFDIKNCRYLVVQGVKIQKKYGFVVLRAGTGSAVGINERSSDIRLSGFQIKHAGFAGIMIKTDPDCDSNTWRSHFVMNQVIIEDNEISGTGGEGIYAGNTAAVRYVVCGNAEVSTPVLPHLLQGLVIRRNRIDSTGADGLQIALAPDAVVEDNYISRYGMRPFEAFQNSGIQLGGGSSGICRRNRIEGGSGNCISAIGIIGGNLIEDNVMCNAGAYGVFIDNRDDFPPQSSTIYLSRNQIINPKLDGIRTYAEPLIHHLRDNYICGIKANAKAVMAADGVEIIED